MKTKETSPVANHAASNGDTLTPPAAGRAAASATEAEPFEALEPHALSPTEIEELRTQAAKAKEHWGQLLRTAADFENFKKRAARERTEASRYATEGLLQKLLPVLDNLEMALGATELTPNAASAALQTGVKMVHQQFKSALAEVGLEEIDARGKAFDPKEHEAVSQQETRELAEGQVVQQLRKGYRLHDRLLRPAAVIVAKPPSAPAPEDA
jgi:molecular chaperone GrpE